MPIEKVYKCSKCGSEWLKLPVKGICPDCDPAALLPKRKEKGKEPEGVKSAMGNPDYFQA